MSKIIMWGACTIKATPISNTGATLESAVTLSAPAQGQTSLSMTEGEKQEAKIEGGAVEAVRRDFDAFQLTCRERVGSANKTDAFSSVDGVVPGEFAIEVTPTENASAPKLNIARATIHVGIEYNATDGAFFVYTYDVLKPASGSMISFT